MSYRDISFNWRATMGNAQALPQDVAEYLDLVADLVTDDVMFKQTSQRHTCSTDDPIVLLDHVRRESLCTTPADYRLYDRAVASVRQHRTTFFCDAEISRRMQEVEADGACPMCGFEVVWHSGEDSQGYKTMMTRCQHSTGCRVQPEFAHAYLRRRSAWQGRHWPWTYMEGKPIPVKDGEPIVKDNHSQTPCLGCNEMEAEERMEQALFKLAASVGDGQFNKPGWSSPVDAYICKRGGQECADTSPCNHAYMHVKGDMQKARGGWGYSSEIRLNGAGLKLYIKPVRSAMSGASVTFGMRVGGDQVNDYPGFQEHAHRIFTECGVPCETA